jgi:hypothetical protein
MAYDTMGCFLPSAGKTPEDIRKTFNITNDFVSVNQ